MAETLTYNTTPDTETLSSDLTPDEQDSLKVGEEIVQQQEQLLAGKYKDAEALEKAYVELSKKLGENSEEKPQIETSEPTPEPEPASNENILEDLWNQATVDKKYKQETVDALNKMSPSDLAKMHLDYRNANQPKKLTQKSMNELKNIAGGDKQYNSMIQWANDNLDSNEISMFDNVMKQGDPNSAFFAVRALTDRYTNATGFDGKTLTGRAPRQNTDIFRSLQELSTAMNDPRYDNDPAYRMDITNKLDRSNLEF